MNERRNFLTAIIAGGGALLGWPFRQAQKTEYKYIRTTVVCSKCKQSKRAVQRHRDNEEPVLFMMECCSCDDKRQHQPPLPRLTVVQCKVCNEDIRAVIHKGYIYRELCECDDSGGGETDAIDGEVELPDRFKTLIFEVKGEWLE